MEAPGAAKVTFPLFIPLSFSSHFSRHYVVVQANPPETGDEPGRTFTIDVDRHPPD